MNAPRQIYARKRDEEIASWWVTWNSQGFLRNQGNWLLEIVDKSELIVVPHGNNNPHLVAEFPLVQHERFQPVRHG